MIMILVELMFAIMLAAAVLIVIPLLLLMAGVAGVVLLWALAPTAVLVAGGLGLACVVALTRPHTVISYATAHEAFIVGAVAIALLVLSLATAATLALRRS